MTVTPVPEPHPEQRLTPPQHLSDEWLYAGPLAVAAHTEPPTAAGAPPRTATAAARSCGAGPWARVLGAALLLALVAVTSWQPDSPAAAGRGGAASACPPGDGPPERGGRGHA